MKKLSVLLIIFLAGCGAHSGSTVSRDQAAIENMADSFATEYKSASDQAEKDLILNNFHTKIGNYLLDHYMNHIRVHVDTMRVDSKMVVMSFHSSGNVAFWGSLSFMKHMSRKEDSLLHFMERLKPGTDTSLDFVYMGKIELNPENDSLKSNLIIHALPISY